MGKITVTCPCGCGHTFEADIIDSDYYENLVAQWAGGVVATSKTQMGYDVSTNIGGEIITIQVKYSSLTALNSHGTKGWKYWHSLTKINPDYFVLFGVINYGYHVFVMSFKTFMGRVAKQGREYHRGMNRYPIILTSSKDSSAWNYHIDNPEKNLLPKIKAMIADGQFGLL